MKDKNKRRTRQHGNPHSGFPKSLMKEAIRLGRARAAGRELPGKNPKLPKEAKVPDKVSKPRRAAEDKAYVRPDDLIIEGATSPAEVPWIRTSDPKSGKEAWIPFADFSDDARPAKARLIKAGIILFEETNKEWVKKARAIQDFPPRPLLESAGWTGQHYALPSARVFSPEGEAEQVVLFDVDPGKCGTKGALKAWKYGVEKLAAGQHMITFVLMAAFAGALLRLSRIQLNLGFELVGSKGVGKSTLQQLIASIFGGAVEPPGRNYWLSANTTMNGLEDCLPAHADSLMVIEEMSLFCAGESDRNRAGKLVDLVFRLSSGTIKKRYQSEEPRHIRFVYVTSSNEPLSGILRHRRSHTSEAASDRLLTIPISPDAQHGIFTKLPDGCDTGDQAARAIVRLVGNHHGLAGERFLERLVEDRAKDEAALKSRIERDIEKFRAAVGVNGNVGSDARVADAFGLVYAAGKLAKHYGALPGDLQCLRAAKECHRLNRRVCGPPPSPINELRALSRHKGVIRVDPTSLKKIPDNVLDAAPAILRPIAKGRVELLLTKVALRRTFTDWQGALKDPGTVPVFKPDRDKPTVKRTVRKNKRQERFYCFELPANDD